MKVLLVSRLPIAFLCTIWFTLFQDLIDWYKPYISSINWLANIRSYWLLHGIWWIFLIALRKQVSTLILTNIDLELTQLVLYTDNEFEFLWTLEG